MTGRAAREREEAPTEWLRVAHIVRPQGRFGEVLADLLTDFPDRFASHPAVHLRSPDAAHPSRAATVTSSRPHSGRVVLKLLDCDSIEAAETLRGYDVVVPWAERMPLAEDEVYVADLAGCVLTDTRTGREVGTVLDVDRESTSSPLLVVESSEAGELLIPFVKAYAPRWNLAAKTLEMELPKGLVEPATGEQA